MKKIIFLIFLCLSFFTLLFAATEKEIFENGVLLFKQGQHQKAIDEFSKLIELAPENADAYKNRGVSYMKQGNFDRAIKDFETAKKLFPELKGLYSNLGVAWYYKKEYEKAIENYDIEIEMAPENHVAYFNRALCLTELGRNKEAFDNISQTLKLKPDFYWAICYKADLLAQEGKDLRAIEAYEEASRLNPEDTYATEKLAHLKQKVNTQETSALPEDKPEVKTDSNKGYALQAAAFLNSENANKMKGKLIRNGFNSRILVLEGAKGRTWYLVRSGNYSSQNEAKKAAVSFQKKLGITPLVRRVGDW